MEIDTLERIPIELRIKELLYSRYESGERPLAWESRVSGTDVVRIDDGRCIRLFSNGGQSPPKPGWILVIRSGNPDEGYGWTLYGLLPGPGR